MSSFGFEAWGPPFPAWLGPYSPARGNRSGFRVHGGKLGAWVTEDGVSSFWTIERSPGVRALEQLVVRHFRGGRVLLLPNGLVVKPLNRDEERGRRVLIGRYAGCVIIESTDEYVDLSDEDYEAGSIWPGPSSIGLECSLSDDGSLRTRWWRETAFGEKSAQCVVHGTDRRLAASFRQVRGESSGRVRVTAHGLVLTNVEEYGEWSPYVVGRIDPASWPHEHAWVGGPIACR